jgi:hypothetical protein
VSKTPSKPTAIEATGNSKADNGVEIRALIPKARKDKDAAQRLLKLMDEEGTTHAFGRIFDIARQTEFSLIRSFTQEDCLACELAERRLKEMRAELAGPNPTPLETLLVERIALCWFHVHLCELTLAQRHADMTLTVAEYQQKRMDKAHKRYLASIKTLAQVRKLQLPTVQVNIGAKQVNVANVNQAAPDKT